MKSGSSADQDEDDERDSSVGLQFSVAVELRRRRGVYADRWEARLTSAAIAVVAALVVLIALLQVFGLLRTVFSG